MITLDKSTQTYQVLAGKINLAHGEGVTAIAVKAAEEDAHVDRNNVALLEGTLIGHSMHGDVVDRGGDTFREGTIVQW